jgi:hypothetical protein
LESLALTIRIKVKAIEYSSSNEYHKVLTRTELKSLRMSNECAKTECE